MKTSEFIKIMNKLGFNHTENYFDLIILKGRKEILRVNKQAELIISNNNSEFNGLDEVIKQQVMKFVWAYICTPVEER